MTKWICLDCLPPCTCDTGSDETTPKVCVLAVSSASWERVDKPESPINIHIERHDFGADLKALKGVLMEIDAPPLQRGDEHKLPRTCLVHEQNIEEMAGNLTALKERVQELEKRQPVIVFDAAKRLERLEHQMRKHYHGGPVWCETEDGSGTERLVK